MSLRTRLTETAVVIEKTASVLKVSDLGAFFLHSGIRTVIKVVSGKFHITVKKVERAVETCHPRTGLTISASEATHAAAHSATAATHSGHHAAGHVHESAVVSIVGVEDNTYLAVFLKITDHTRALVTPAAVKERGFIIIIARIRNIVTATGHEITEPSVHHALVDREVDDSLLVTVIYTCEYSLIRLLLHHLHLFYHLCRKVLRSKLRVIEEEGLSVDGDLRDCLTIGCDRSVGIDFHARKLLEEVLKHIIVRGLE